MLFKIKPFEKDNINHTLVRVSLDYDKDKQGPVATLQTMGLTADGNETFSIFGSPRLRVTLENGWKSNNKKRMIVASDMAAHQVAAKSGPVWEGLRDLLIPLGSEVIYPQVA